MCHLQAPRRRATCGTAFSILLLSGLCPTSTALLEAPTPGVNKPRWTFRSACGRAFRPQTINVLLSRRTGSSHGGDRLLHKRRASLEAVVEATRLSGGATGAGKDSVSGPRVITEQVGSRTVHVVWDESQGRYVDYASGKSKTDRFRGGIGDLRAFLKHCFIPEDVSPDYFNFTRWRIFQRFVAATVSVLGTQALLLALGIKSRSIGAAAAISWVLKDALGKFVRILWASKMGRRFDSDAKRWRYRSSLLYATGSGLEIVTYVFPSLFLFLATVANALKQMSMLTSSATRNTIYRSFARGENIGDITAKGEAQIACVDLLGLMGGICLSKALGTSRVSIGAAYVLLSAIDIFAIYHEIRSVVFTML
ncbi:vitamin B6 photo-protection and homoeostasis-domain-containing protein, partial [Tribonema minus]